MSKRFISVTLAAAAAALAFNFASAQSGNQAAAETAGQSRTGVPQAGNAAAGSIKFETCRGCHAIQSYTNVYPTYNVPRLGGQNVDYVVSALNAYRSGERKHPTMQAMSRALTEQDIANIAAYLNSVQ